LGIVWPVEVIVEIAWAIVIAGTAWGIKIKALIIHFARVCESLANKPSALWAG
jgi:hypothetical protein